MEVEGDTLVGTCLFCQSAPPHTHTIKAPHVYVMFEQGAAGRVWRADDSSKWRVHGHSARATVRLSAHGVPIDCWRRCVRVCACLFSSLCVDHTPLCVRVCWWVCLRACSRECVCVCVCVVANLCVNVARPHHLNVYVCVMCVCCSCVPICVPVSCARVCVPPCVRVQACGDRITGELRTC